MALHPTDRRRTRSERGHPEGPSAPGGRLLAIAVALGVAARLVAGTLRLVVRIPVAAVGCSWRLGRHLRKGGETPATGVRRGSTGQERRGAGTKPALAVQLAAGTLVLVLGAFAIHRTVDPSSDRSHGGDSWIRVLPKTSDPGLGMPVRGVEAATLHRSFDDPRSGGRLHRALDIPAPAGTPIVAAAGGVVLRTSLGGLAGLSVCVRSEELGLDHFYAHMATLGPNARAGQRVERGEVLGSVGATGNAARSGPHLHFQVVRARSGQRCGQGEPVDPYDLLVP